MSFSLRSGVHAVAAMGMVAGLLLASSAKGADAVSVDNRPVELEIFVSDGQGSTSDGRLTCVGNQNAATGFLAVGDVDALCAVARGLSGFLFAEPDRDRPSTMEYGGPDTARIRGFIGGLAIDREFSLRDGAEINDWVRASPLFENSVSTFQRRYDAVHPEARHRLSFLCDVHRR